MKDFKITFTKRSYVILIMVGLMYALVPFVEKARKAHPERFISADVKNYFKTAKARWDLVNIKAKEINTLFEELFFF